MEMLGSVPTESFLSIHHTPTFVLLDLKVLSTLRCIDNLRLKVECETGMMEVSEAAPGKVSVPLVALQGQAEPPELWCWQDLVSCSRRQSELGLAALREGIWQPNVDV